ncbi:hypothetical protein HK097_001857 [Rhizophlyctis rosea]|uniref:Uncharacterized protein n=1 Tax=Rhizophlyctis rosea TaxID=64517 RepID=A0AAD5X1L5_9FUNG|nr:hypothetical protein HK097_001857 [Rhizophlyctis rosea]
MDYDDDDLRQYEDDLYGSHSEAEHDSESEAGELEAKIQFNGGWADNSGDEEFEVDLKDFTGSTLQNGDQSPRSPEPTSLSDEEDRIQKGVPSQKRKTDIIISAISDSDEEEDIDANPTPKKPRLDKDDEATPRPTIRTIRFDPNTPAKPVVSTFVGEDAVEVEPPRPASARNISNTGHVSANPAPGDQHLLKDHSKAIISAEIQEEVPPNLAAIKEADKMALAGIGRGQYHQVHNGICGLLRGRLLHHRYGTDHHRLGRMWIAIMVRRVEVGHLGTGNEKTGILTGLAAMAMKMVVAVVVPPPLPPGVDGGWKWCRI